MTDYQLHVGPEHFRTGETIIQANNEIFFSYEIHLKVKNITYS